MEKELPPLKPATARFLLVLKEFNGKQINLRQYALMIGVSRRRVRVMVSELRTKGYINIIPENTKIHKSQSCRYIFLDGTPINSAPILTEAMKKKLGMDLS